MGRGWRFFTKRYCSATAQESIKQRIARGIDELEDLLKPFITAVVGIGHLYGPGGLVMREQERYLGCRRAARQEMITIVSIHADDVVELVKVLLRHLAGPADKRDAIALSGLPHAMIRQFASMPPAGAGRVDTETVRDAALVHLMKKEPLGQRTAADIAHADEQNGDALRHGGKIGGEGRRGEGAEGRRGRGAKGQRDRGAEGQRDKVTFRPFDVSTFRPFDVSTFRRFDVSTFRRLNSTSHQPLPRPAPSIFLIVCAVIAVALVACRPNAPVAADDNASGRLRVVVTIRPLELIVRELLLDSALAERVELSTILAPEVSPHGFEPTSAQVAMLQRADLVILNGLGLDDWAARGLPARTRLARFDDVVDLEAEHENLHEHDHAHDHAHGPECDHGPIDEHFWVDPELVRAFAALLAREIEQGLGRTEPEAEAIAALRERFNHVVARVDEDLKRLLEAHRGRRIVTHHNVFSRLANRYGLGEPIVLRRLAALEPSPGDLRRAIEHIRQEHIHAILIEPQFAAAAAERVRNETNAALIEVDPLGIDAATWSDMMRSIGGAIARSLEQNVAD